MQVLPPRAPAPDWPPFKPTQPRHVARTGLTPEPVVPSAAVANAMLGPLTVSSQNQAAPTGTYQHSKDHTYIFPILLIVSVILILAAALVLVLAFKGRQCMRTLMRGRSRHSPGADQVLELANCSGKCQASGLTGTSCNVGSRKSTRERDRTRLCGLGSNLKV